MIYSFKLHPLRSQVRLSLIKQELRCVHSSWAFRVKSSHCKVCSICICSLSLPSFPPSLPLPLSKCTGSGHTLFMESSLPLFLSTSLPPLHFLIFSLLFFFFLVLTLGRETSLSVFRHLKLSANHNLKCPPLLLNHETCISTLYNYYHASF